MDNIITKKEAEETYTIIRHAIRNAAIKLDPDMWKVLRKFEPDYDISIDSNINHFFNKDYVSGLLKELNRQKEQGNSEYTKEHIAMVSIISLYIYFKISKILYVSDIRDYYFDNGEFYEYIKIGSDADDDNIIYNLEEEILKMTDQHKWCTTTNIPFIIVGVQSDPDKESPVISEKQVVADDIICIDIMEYNKHHVKYETIIISKKDEIILSIKTWYHNMNYSMLIEHAVINDDTSIILASGFTTCVGSKDGITTADIINKENYIKATNRSKFALVEVEKYIEVCKKNICSLLQGAYSSHKGFNEYINREPEIKTLVERMERMTPSSLKIIENDHPHINKLIQTLYKYEEFENKPIKRVNRGGTHASPCRHERRETMKYNPKTGKRDIYVRGCTVNKHKAPAQYYKNK